MSMKRVLFHRAYYGFTGGHLKFWDYYNHVRGSGDHIPLISFSDDSVWDSTNPWLQERASVVPDWRAADADVLFLAGTDWLVLDGQQRDRPPCPVINFIQGVRHARPQDVRHQFLQHPAIRICASGEIASALKSLGTVRGPIFTIVYGLDTRSFPEPLPDSERPVDLLILGSKQPAMGERVSEYFMQQTRGGAPLAGRRIEAVNSTIPREAFLEKLSQARTTVFLPSWEEGFFLPALEGMALGSLIVCPDCVGNRTFCLPDENCLRPAFTEEAVVQATERAIHLSPDRRSALLANALAMARTHGMETERQSFLQILRDAPALWQQIV